MKTTKTVKWQKTEPSDYDENNALLSALDDSLAIIEFDLYNRIIEVNQNYLDYFGYKREEVIGQPHLIFCHPGYANSEEYQEIKKCFLAGQSLEGHFERLHKDGSTVWLAAIYQPVRGPGGSVTRMVKIAKDITFFIEQQKLTREWVKLYPVLAALVQECPLDEVMSMLCLEIERIAPEVTASILQINEECYLTPLLAPPYHRLIQPHSPMCLSAHFRDPAVPLHFANNRSKYKISPLTRYGKITVI